MAAASLPTSLLPLRSATPFALPPSLLLLPSSRSQALQLHGLRYSLAVASASSPSRRSSFARLVSLAPIEQAPAPDFDFKGEISRLRDLRSCLRDAAGGGLCQKLRVLDADSRVRGFFGGTHEGCFFGELGLLGEWEEFLVKSVVAAGQGHVLMAEVEMAVEELDVRKDVNGGRVANGALHALEGAVEKWSLSGNGAGDSRVERVESESLKRFLKILDDIQQFYDCIGGIIGYQLTALELLLPQKMERRIAIRDPYSYDQMKGQFVEFFVPNGLNLFQNTEYASQAALWGIEGLPLLGEIYPLGGAGDRLGLVDPDTGECLPAAMLPYCGRTLLEGLMRDLQAREFLYFKIFCKQCITPVAIMTSSVKNNHRHMIELCENLAWFGRGRNSFCFFEQPLVPVVAAEDGQWLFTGPLSPVCKPGGHGAIWKLAHDKGVFKWFYHQGRKGATVRQVSNVVAATDVTLLALAGIGLHNQKKFGFASCQRISGATEGINVLIEKTTPDSQWEYGITCVEYTEFEKFSITDENVSGSLLAEFPANTNILYIDLQSAEEVGSRQSESCLPGLVLNLKKAISFVDHRGIQHSVSGGRLECTMQNIADSFVNRYKSKLGKSIEDTLDTFIVHNERKRVTSSAKRKRKRPDDSLHQTPDGSLLDIMRNASDLLSHCGINIPQIEDNSRYLHSGPPFLIFLHPALGPLWEVTQQKFFGGSVSMGSELLIEVAEFFWRDIQLDGSLVIVAENIMGATQTVENSDPILHYGYRCARCKLQNIRVLNRGVDWTCPNNIYWMHHVQRLESLHIILHGNAEFEARDVIFQGNHVFEVPDGYRMSIAPGDAGHRITLDPIKEELMDRGSWFWKYSLDGTHIRLQMVQA